MKTITVDELKKKLEGLNQQQRQLEMNIVAVQGAKQQIEQLIKEAEDGGKSGKPACKTRDEN